MIGCALGSLKNSPILVEVSPKWLQVFEQKNAKRLVLVL